jgi:hypothetical protein
MNVELDRWTFKFGDALPADEPSARFVVSIGAALNDLLFLNRIYVPGQSWSLLRREGTPNENSYIIRLVASTVFELCRLVDKAGRHESIRTLLEKLDSIGLGDLRQFMSLAGLRPRLEHIRNSTSHYPWPDETTLVDALIALADDRGDFEATRGSMATLRVNFADDVLIQTFGANEEDIRSLVEGLADLVTTAIRLCQQIVMAYVRSLPPGVVAYEPSSLT